jgi:RNA polymerase sigma-70 factor (ECF subfamily)
MDTAHLIKEARQGSAAAQKFLFENWQKKMMLICMRYLKNEQDAEEALLDGFYKFFTSLYQFTYQNEAALHGWLKKIMVTACLMQLRKKNAFAIVSEYDAANVPLPEDALNMLNTKEILHLIVQLPIGYRTVFNLYMIEGFSHKEIAQLLQIEEGTSKSQLSKAKLLLQKNLTHYTNQYAKQQSK